MSKEGFFDAIKQAANDHSKELVIGTIAIATGFVSTVPKFMVFGKQNNQTSIRRALAYKNLRPSRLEVTEDAINERENIRDASNVPFIIRSDLEVWSGLIATDRSYIVAGPHGIVM